jgi:hypothetical protein
MKKIDFDSAETLLKLKESLNNIIDRRVAQIRLNESLSIIDKLPFARLNSLFECTLDKLSENKENNKLIGRYIKAIRECKDVKNVYSLYSTINNSSNISDPVLFINEAISLMPTIDKKAYENGVRKVAEIVKECVMRSGMTPSDLAEEVGKYSGSINESIDYLFSNTKTISNVIEYSNNLSKVSDYILENKKDNCVDGQLTENLESINDIISELNKITSAEDALLEGKVAKDVAIASLTESDAKRTVFENYKNSCLHLMDEGIEKSDGNNERASRLTEMKQKLSGKQYNEATINEDMLMLSELMDTLSDK